jgi:hypothetical protein
MALALTNTGEQFTRPLGMPLASATLTDVRATFGPTDSWEQGSGGEQYTAICYRGKGLARITFMSGVLGEPGKRVTTVVLAVDTERETHRCALLPPSLNTEIAAGIGGLRLGMRADEFRRVVGDVMTIEDGRLAAGSSIVIR